MKRYSCSRCGNDKFYRIRRSKKRCSRCLYEFTPKPVKNSRLAIKKWKQIIEWFLLERSGLWTAKKMGLSKNLVYKAFNKIRQVCLTDVPEIFSGTIEVDETYLGGQKKNKTKKQLRKEPKSKRGFGTTKQPVFGILTRHGKVFAQLIDDREAKDLIPIITKQVETGSKICSDTWRAYTGLAAKGYVHRTVEHGEKEYVRGRVFAGMVLLIRCLNQRQCIWARARNFTSKRQNWCCPTSSRRAGTHCMGSWSRRGSCCWFLSESRAAPQSD